MNASVEEQQKQKGPKFEAAHPTRHCVVEERSEGSAPHDEGRHSHRQRNDEEILAVLPKSLRADVGVGLSESVFVVTALLLCEVGEGLRVDAQQSENGFVVHQTPFFGLNFVEGFEDGVHRFSVSSVVELKQINIVEDSEKVKQRRNHPPRSGHRNQQFE